MKLINYLINFINNPIFQLIFGGILNMAFWHFLSTLDKVTFMQIHISLFLAAILFLFLTLSIIANLQFAKNSEFHPHISGFFQKNNFFYCQNHSTPALMGVFSIELQEIIFQCTACEKKWVYIWKQTTVPSPKTHKELCEMLPFDKKY